MGGASKSAKYALAGIVILAMGACTAQYRNHGYIPSEEDLSQILVGVDTRDTVEDLVGVPSTAGVLNDSGYYYVRSRVRSFVYQAPEVIDRQLLAISFDTAGVVTNIERFGLEDGQVVPLSRRVTRSGDAQRSLIRKLLGNLGRFNVGDILGG